jgi:hypothetical protein
MQGLWAGWLKLRESEPAQPGPSSQMAYHDFCTASSPLSVAGEAGTGGERAIGKAGQSGLDGIGGKHDATTKAIDAADLCIFSLASAGSTCRPEP